MKVLLVLALLFVRSMAVAEINHGDCVTTVQTLPTLTMKQKVGAKTMAYNYNKYARESGYPEDPAIEQCYQDFFVFAVHSSLILDTCGIEDKKMGEEMYLKLTGRTVQTCGGN